jgi:hypothetical protein
MLDPSGNYPMRKLRRRVMAESIGQGRVAITYFARLTKLIISSISAGLPASVLCPWLKNFDIASIVTMRTSDVIWRLALSAYYFSWIVGTINDTNIQEIRYVTVPKWSLHTYVVVLIIFVVAAALCLTEGNIEWFAISLSAFVLVDHISLALFNLVYETSS